MTDLASISKKENDMDYVKDGTLTIQARTIKEVNSIDRVVVYADGCQREYLMPLPTIKERKEGKWIKRDKWLYCSACDGGGWGLGAVTYEWRYCPLCGAKIGE